MVESTIEKVEVWKNIYWVSDRYQISNFGNIRGLLKLKNTKDSDFEPHMVALKKFKRGGGYYAVSLCDCYGIKRQYAIHRLVSIAFIINECNKPHVNHKDGNKLNNMVDNLEWCTIAENNIHAYRTGLTPKLTTEIHRMGVEASKKICSKRVSQYDLNGNHIASYYSTCEASRQTGINQQSISRVACGVFKQTNGYGWKYE